MLLNIRPIFSRVQMSRNHSPVCYLRGDRRFIVAVAPRFSFTMQVKEVHFSAREPVIGAHDHQLAGFLTLKEYVRRILAQVTHHVSYILADVCLDTLRTR